VIPALFATALHLAPCTIAGAVARCGTFERGSVAMKVIVLPATEKNQSAIFPFNGGPGRIITDAAELEVKELAAERRFHDVVMMDARGTATSSPLTCSEAMKKHARALVEEDLLPNARVADCRREVEAHANPAHYTFEYFVDDVEALRRALGYGPINIFAISYGTRAALTFQSKYPKSVRSMLLYGPLPPENRMPLEAARDAQAVMDRIAPDQTELNAALSSLPVDISSGGYTIHMTRGAFAEYLRSMLYTAEKQAKVPAIIDQAAQGDWKSIAPGFIEQRKHWYEGMEIFLSITCPTDVRYISSAEIPFATANTFLGDYRVRRQIAACEQWTPGFAPRVRVLTKSKTPILIFTGEMDPVTPKRWAEVLAAPNVRIVVSAAKGHTEFNPCTDRLEIEFFDAGAFDKLDDACARKP
jgi:pimeloyl-ACP methyl ester carboxylesterase